MYINHWIKRAKRMFNPCSLVLMYHRVAVPDIDPWELSLSPANFEQQLQVLKKTGLVVPMATLIEQFYFKTISKSFIVISFDDGYVDNYLAAKPLLEKYELPATFFISTKHIGMKKEFWWDELAYILLHLHKLPSTLSFCLNSITLSYDLKEEEVLTEEMFQKHKLWNYTQPPPTHRAKIYMQIWKLLSPLSYHEQQLILEDLKLCTGVKFQNRKSFFSMSENQLIDLASKKLFTIGAHTVSHPALAYHSEEIQYQEIDQNKQYLEAITGLNINTFAYPSGKFNETTIDVLKKQDFLAAFTTHEKIVKQGDDPFRISRFQVKNWESNNFKKKLKNWL